MPGQSGQFGPAGYPGYAAYPGQPAPGGYDPSQPYPVQYDPSQPYVIYQAMPSGGMFHGVIGEGDPLVSPDYSGWWRRTISVLRQGWRSLALLQVIGFAVSLLFSVPQALLLLNLTDELDQASRTVDPDTGQPVTPDLGPLFAFLGFTFLGAFLGVMVSFVVAIACNHVAVSVAAGLRPRIGAALGLAVRRMFPLLGWQVLAGLILLAGVCACILPAFYLIAVFTVLPVVVTFERGASAISRCFRLFHQDLSASISRVATIAGISIGVGVIAYIVSSIIQLVPGTPAFDPGSAEPFGGVGTGYLVAVVAGTVVADLMARAGAVQTAPLTLAAYADMRARVEPLTTATLANEAGLTPPQAHDPQQYDPQVHGPQQFGPQAYAAQQFDPQGYAPQQYNAPAHDPQAHGPQQHGAQQPGEVPPAQDGSAQQGPDSDWMPPNR